MTTKNPFPGMNPFFEQRWRDAYSSKNGLLAHRHFGRPRLVQPCGGFQ
jgi:hypothetical protein